MPQKVVENSEKTSVFDVILELTLFLSVADNTKFVGIISKY